MIDLSLGSLCEITSSKRIFAEEYVAEGIPFYRSKEIIEKNNNQIISDPLFISPSRFEEIKKKFGVPVSGDVLLTSVGTLGIPYRVKNTDLFYFKDGNLIWMKSFSDKLDSQYLYYWFSSNFGKQSLTQKAIGSSQAALTIEILKNYKLPVPALPIQQKIASILSAYDSMIENNQKRIKLLEQMAENLYKEWFVKFRFPGYETAEFEDGVPKGWKQVRLGAYSDAIMGQSPESCFYNDEKKGLPFHQGCGSYGDFYLEDGIYSTEGKRLAEPNSIIFSVRAPVGRINITLNKIILGRGVAGINAKNGHNAFLLWLLKYQFAKEDIIGNGSIFTSVTKDELLGQKLLIPTKELEESFNKIASNIEKLIRFLTLQKKNLTTQRDILLPRLMSGKLSI